MPSAPITEYVYCDEQRLNSYFEQISHPVAYDKTPIWKFGLGLAGPTVEGTQGRPGRSFTTHEKVQKVVSYLHDNDLLDRGRLQDTFDQSERPFRVEAMSARKAVIPPRADVEHFPGLSLWVSVAQDTGRKGRRTSMSGRPVGAVILLEAYKNDDFDDIGIRISGNSWLELLSRTVDDAFRAKWTDDVIGARDLVRGLRPQFAIDPIEALSRLGAIFTPERRVTALYRVRAACNALEQSLAVTTIGYPIVVTAEGGVLDSPGKPGKRRIKMNQ